MVIDTVEGVLTLTGYNPTTGVVSYTYDPKLQNVNGSVVDHIPLTVTDDLDTPTSGTLDITITDSAPVAVDDAASITEDALPNTVSGNVLLGAGADTVGADTNASPVTPVSNLSLTYGTLTLGADGVYTYTLDNGNPLVNALNGSSTPLTDSYTYTLTDGDGTQTTATLTITINGTNDAPVIGAAGALLSDEGLNGGIADSSGLSDETNSVSFTDRVVVSDVEGDSLTVTLVAPTTILKSGGTDIVWTLSSDGKTLSGAVGSGGPEALSVTINDSGDYTVTLSKPLDHPNTSGEDVLNFNVGINVSDGTAVSSSSLVVSIEDDMPVASASTSVLEVGVDTVSINSLRAGWVNPVFINGTAQVSQTNTDSDAYNDQMLWGTAATGNGQSGYTLVDNTTLVNSTGVVVTPGSLFKLADFSHLNWPVYSNSSTLDQVTLTMTMNVVINGVTTPIQFDVLLDHNETPNVDGDALASRDIISLPTQDVTVTVAGQDYTFRLEGFRNSSGSIVNTIYTDEQATNPFEIYGSLRTTDALPTISGAITAAPGADGLSNVTWDSLSSSYGTMTANADGTYQFVVNRETRESMTYGQVLTQTFNYTITDKDGDSVQSSVTVEIRAPEAVTLHSTSTDITGVNVGLAGEYFGYNDSRTGTATDPKYSGATATRLHSDDGTADAGAANNIDRLADVEEIVEGRNGDTTLVGSTRTSSTQAADATFSVNRLELGLNPGSNSTLVNNDLGQNGRVESGNIGASATVGGTNNLYTFLKVSAGNADNLVATGGLGDTTDAVIRMVGYIYIPAGGVYDMRITGDDGYRIIIGTQNLGQFDDNQAPGTQTYTNLTLAEGLQPIEILYWDQAGQAALRVEIKTSGAADSTYQVIGTDAFALFAPDAVPTLTASQDIVESSTNGVWQIREGENYTGTNYGEKITGSDAKDVIQAAGGDDLVLGGAGSDTIQGGAGNDTLTGGLGSDTFAWTLLDQGSVAIPAKDIITDFNVASKAAGGDVLDLRDLLPTATTGATLDVYLNFSKSGSDTVIDVKPDGTNVTQQIVLAGVDLGATGTNDVAIINDLLTKGKLLTD